MMHTAVLNVCSPQTEIVKCFIWRGFVSSNYFIDLHQLQEWLTLSSRSLKMLIIRKLLMEDIEPLTYLMVSAVKTFSPTAIRFSNLLSLGNVLAIHSFWSMNWGEIRFGDAQTNKSILTGEPYGVHRSSWSVSWSQKRSPPERAPQKRREKRMTSQGWLTTNSPHLHHCTNLNFTLFHL